MRPPRSAERLVRWAFRDDPALPAILGDLQEELHARADRQGPTAAAWWYVREAIGLTASAAWGALVRPEPSRRMSRTAALRQDLRWSLRSLRRAPGFTLLTAVVIGLGVGATTAVFSVLRPLLIAPLPFENPHELVWIANSGPDEGSLSGVTSRTSNVMDFRERSRTLTGITAINAFSAQQSYTLEADGLVERLHGFGVAPDFFDVLGVELAHGRSFNEEESTFDGPAAMILSHALWRQRFGADVGVVGSTVTLNGAPARVIGVLPASFDFASVFTPGQQVDFLTLWEISDRTDAWGNTVHMIGRLRPDATAATAQSDLDALVTALGEEDPDRWGLAARVTPLHEKISAPVRSGLLLLAGAAATVLLIVCVNVSNMLLARMPGRMREIAIRKAMGAPRGRIVRQLVSESTLIALAGSVVGAGLAWAATRFVSATAGIRVPLLDRVAVDGAALAFAALVAIGTGVVVGVLPALRASDGREAGLIRGGSRTATSTVGARRLRESLVVAEVALATVLLVTGGLLVRSFQAVMSVDLGFEPGNAVAWQLNPTQQFDGHEGVVAWHEAVEERVRAVPGVSAAGMIDGLPLGRNRSWGFDVVGWDDEANTGIGLYPHIVSPGYLEAMRTPLVAGRTLQRYDDASSYRAIVINESAATDMFGSPDAAVGQEFELWHDTPWRVVGVVGDVLHVSPESGAGTQVYFTLAQMPDYAGMELVVRSTRPLSETVADVGAAMSAVDPSLPTDGFWTLEDRVATAVSARRFLLQVLGAFGAAALLLAGMGIYGVLAYTVAERASEIGIRMALGASSSTVLMSVVRRTLALAAVGLGVGAVVAVAASGALRSLLFGVGPSDPMTYLATGTMLLAVATLAGLVPAVRAARITGVRALQSE